MKNKYLTILLALLLTAVLLIGCSSATTNTSEPAAPADTSADTSASSDTPYIAVISKGFQHQFWQAVKAGAEKAATDYNVTITFEGPETEAMVDKQVEMVQAALDKNPAALCLAALDTQALTPLLERAQSEGIPVVGFDFMVPDLAGEQYAIIEANERPGLANHEPQPTAQRFVDLLFPHSRMEP